MVVKNTVLYLLTFVAGLLMSNPLWANQPAKPTTGRSLTLFPIDREPQLGQKSFTAAEIKALRKAVEQSPKTRKHRFDLIRALMANKAHAAALTAAKAWREVDAYNLVVVRLIGDIYTELGETAKAKRAYSAVVELLPHDAQAERALATVLKQAGDKQGAYERLLVAAQSRPEDFRLAFELADAAQRLGNLTEARRRFGEIIQHQDVREDVQYPAKQRLAQILAHHRVTALKEQQSAQAESLAKQIADLNVKGGAQNDIKIYLSWDTDGSDVDLWVVNPAGQKIFYSRKRGKFGGTLFHDVTTGYGPESFTATRAHRGDYLVKVNYFDTNRSAFTEARGEVVVILNEGTETETRHVLPYRLFHPKQTVTVAKIHVE